MPKNKKWVLKGGSEEIRVKAKEIQREFGLEGASANILAVRGYDTKEKVQTFLGKENTLMHNPFLMKDMDKAVKRILSAVESGEGITVYGDYDVDGVSAVSVLYLYLKSIGACVNYYIPSRAGEGYGINKSALDMLKERGTSLIVTVDTGITAIEEAEYMKQLGLSLVVTDHHGCHDALPDACAVVNPRRSDDEYPFKELAGVGVVFKLVTALEFAVQENRLFGGCGELTLEQRFARMTECKESDFLEKVCNAYLDLVTLGTVSDVMTLTDENRLICSYGLSLIENSPRLGLVALMDYADGMKNRRYPRKRKITASYIGFTLAPRINAAGRISDASLGVELFTTEQRTRADEIAAELCELNTMRQAEENRIATEAMALAESTHDFENDPVLVLASESWHNGVIGIVSSRLTEKFNMPSILITVEDGVGKGSGRSIKGLNISTALSECSELLIRYGGHELAAGLTIDVNNIDEFRRRINDYARRTMSADASDVILEIDCEVSAEEINLKLAEEIAYLEPCGVGNPQPVMLIRGAEVQYAESIGEGKHTKLVLDGKTALMFGVPLCEADVREGDVIDAVFKLDINDFRGTRTEQLLLCDLKMSRGAEHLDREISYLESVENGEEFEQSDELLPDRDDFARVYKEIRAYGEDGATVSLYRLEDIIAKSGEPMRAAKIKLALEILSDVGLIKLDVLAVHTLSGAEIYRLAASKTTDKINLFGTPRYKNVKNRMMKGI